MPCNASCTFTTPASHCPRTPTDPPADGPPLLVVATDKYVGEGYDCPRLDTLFLAHPVSFKGSMVQYVGRILRTYPGKTTVEVHGYTDRNVGVLTAMWRKRSRSYSQLGFTLAEGTE